MSALEIGHVIVDRTPKPPEFGEDIWIPGREPGDTQLLLGAVGEWITRPTAQLAAVRSAATGMITSTEQLIDAGRWIIDAARTFARGTAPNSPLNATVSRNRRFTVAVHDLEDYRRLRSRFDCDVNDVVLAVVAGALRNWLLSRGEPVSSAKTVRAMAPMSVYPDADLDTAAGPGQAISEVSPFLVDLPVGEGNAVVRLSQISHATETQATASSPVDARTIVTLSGFAPPTLHAMGTRVATSFPARQFNLLITNVPGAQKQMYVAGTKLLDTFAVPPLLNNQVLALGVTSYNGMMYFGINADREAMSDVEVFPSLLRESLDELLESGQ
jgi:diacylglycerol O-acyltransferase